MDPIGGSRLTIWGNPATRLTTENAASAPKAPAAPAAPDQLAKSPSCLAPRLGTAAGSSPTLQQPGTYLGDPTLRPNWVTGGGHPRQPTPPNPLGMTGCGKLGFSPSITAQPTTKAASSPTGLDFGLNVQDEGITNPAGLAQSDIRNR